MLLITPLIIGALVGALMAVLFKRSEYIFHNVVLGIVGAIILRVIAYFILESKSAASHGFSFIGVLSSLVGAMLVPYIFKLFPPIKTQGNQSKDSSENKKGSTDTSG